MTMTYAQALEIAINAVIDEEAVDRLTALKAQLEKRSTSKTPTKTQKENEVIMDRMVEVLSSLESPVTVSELIASNESFEGMSNQKASALLKKLVEAGRAVKTIEKKKSYFSIA